MEDTLENWLLILSHGLYCGIFISFVSVMFSYLLKTIISWFKKLI